MFTADNEIRGHLNWQNRWGSAFWWNKGGFEILKKHNFIITIRYESGEEIKSFIQKCQNHFNTLKPNRHCKFLLSLLLANSSSWIQFFNPRPFPIFLYNSKNIYGNYDIFKNKWALIKSWVPFSFRDMFSYFDFSLF